MTDLTDLTISQAISGLKNKEFKATELTKAYIRNMESGRKYNAYVTECTEKALEQAEVSDEKYAKGIAGDLEGIPLGVKDLKITGLNRKIENPQ